MTSKADDFSKHNKLKQITIRHIYTKSQTKYVGFKKNNVNVIQSYAKLRRHLENIIFW